MSKAVLLSIRPEWVEKILSGEKTLEVRKTEPSLDTPFKCYIYCTSSGGCLTDETGAVSLNRKVVAEFTCDHVECVDIPYPAFQEKLHKRYIEQSCVSYYALHHYVYHDAAYFWHITNPKIYGQPKELSEFTGLRKTKFGSEPVPLKRPPQSWCYVVEVE